MINSIMINFKIIQYSDNTFIIKEKIFLFFYYKWSSTFYTLKDAKQSIDEYIEKRKEQKNKVIKTHYYNGPIR